MLGTLVVLQVPLPIVLVTFLKFSSFHFSGLSLFFQRSLLMDKPVQKNVDFLVTPTPGDKLTNSFLSN